MCKSTDNRVFNFDTNRDRIKFNQFYIKFSELKSCSTRLPDSLTLVYLPRINNSPLEINGSQIRPDAPAFLTLYRVGLVGKNGALFVSRDTVKASETVRVEVFWREKRILRGTFRNHEGLKWNLECTCAMERKILGFDTAATVTAEICLSAVGVENEEGKGHGMVYERLEMVVKRKRVRSFERLDEIPEERENDDDDDIVDGCDESCRECGEGEDLSEVDGEDCEVDGEGVRWAVDVGFWVMSLGLSLLVTTASYKSLRLHKFYSNMFLGSFVMTR